MRIFKTKPFDRFARKERIADDAIREAIKRAERGLVDADLGGNVIKQRVARQGQGRSGGYRTIVLLRASARAVFAYGFAKCQRRLKFPQKCRGNLPRFWVPVIGRVQ